MRLAELWRYPIKSLAGERLWTVSINARGVEGDRLWALVDPEGGIASGKTARRFRALSGLMHHRSHLEHGDPVITLADGRSARIDSPELAELVAAITPPGWSLQREDRTPHFDAGAIHVVTTTTLATLGELFGERVPVQRLRPNLLLDTDHSALFPEDAWLGRTLHVGPVKLRVVERTVRCVMVGHAQTQLEARSKLLKTIGRVNDACAGVYAEVLEPGTVTQSDPAILT